MKISGYITGVIVTELIIYAITGNTAGEVLLRVLLQLLR